MPTYSVDTQIDIIMACFALHNYILEHKHNDAIFDDDEEEECQRFGPEDEGEDNNPKGMGTVRDAITAQIWADKRRYLGAM